MDPMITVGVVGAIAVLGALIALAVRKKLNPPRPARPTLPVVYTNHARERMHERGVAAADLESVLASPTRATPDAAQASWKLERDFDSKTLKVWVKAPWPATKEIVVKSTAWQYYDRFTIPTTAIGRVKGRAGATVKRISTNTDAKIHITQDGSVRISAGDLAAVRAARREINKLVGVADSPASASRSLRTRPARQGHRR